MKTAQATVGIWYDSDTGHIHLTIPDTDWFHTTINDKPGSERRHHNLYVKLSRYLRESGLPSPDDQLT